MGEDKTCGEMEASHPSSTWRRLRWGQWCAVVTLWVAVCLTIQLPAGADWIDVVFFALLVWQCQMLGFWAGLGRSRIRFAWIVPAILALGGLSGYAARGETLEFQIFCWSIALVVGVTTGVLRRLAGSLQQIAEPTLIREGLQFGIRQVMIWTAVLALLFAGSRWLMQLQGFRRVELNTIAFIVGLAVTMAGATVVAVWACLGQRVGASRIVGMVLALGCGVVATQLLGEQWQFTASAGVAQLGVLLSLSLLRLDRFRFVKRSATGSDSPEGVRSAPGDAEIG